MTEQNENVAESEISFLKKSLTEALHTANTLRLQLDSEKKANSVLSSQVGILTANVKVIREQRDLFMERDADARVDAAQAQRNADKQIQALQINQESLAKQLEPYRDKLNASNSNLAEVREKFTELKSENKKLNSALSEANSSAVQMESVLFWYSDLLCQTRRNVEKNFVAKTGEQVYYTLLLSVYNDWRNRPRPPEKLDEVLIEKHNELTSI